MRLNAIVTVACSRVATAAVWSVPCLKRVPHSPHCKYIAWSAQQYSRVSTVGAQWFGPFSRLAAEIVTLNLVLCLAEMRFSFGFFTGTRLFALSLHTFAKQSKADVPTALHRTPVVPLWM